MNNMILHEYHDLTWISWFAINNMIWNDLTNNKTDSKMAAEGSVGAPTCFSLKAPTIIFCFFRK
jgi:hypothetical protein